MAVTPEEHISVYRSQPLMLRHQEVRFRLAELGQAQGELTSLALLTTEPLLTGYLAPHAWTELQIQEYFSVGPDQLSKLDVWDWITSYIVPGTEFPAVIDLKGSLSGGALHNGQPTDFVP